ncbi:hypothetical protein L228DRAFT_262378 [Xylona heveae TC161]|uniref:Uncharacterized protein n=1 Tax=Xylona heveae (strain CBS 132557 / TC161) TaxID=1328760 RepID=A0A165FTB8_XYLHT|nr:hypothetical protein L228DRAFT_262378 [Xylona heveae TC161]KZF21351.1 hypothetical protein L228DRAFT_262378 [Xylona heveae TC161]
MEGFLSLPPERSSILGRSPWKFLVKSTAHALNASQEDRLRIACTLLGNKQNPRALANRRTARAQTLYNVVRGEFQYTSKRLVKLDLIDHKNCIRERHGKLTFGRLQNDSDCIVRYPLSRFRTCFVEDIMRRKPGPARPTLILELEQEAPGTPTGGRRRSSQNSVASPFSSKSRQRTLLFRSDENRPSPSLLEWRDAILQHMSQVSPGVDFNPNFSFGRSKGFSLSSSTRPTLPHLQQSYHSTTSGYPPSVLLSPTCSIGSNRSEMSSSNSDKKSHFSKISDLPSPMVDSPVTPMAAASLNPGLASLYSQPSPGSPHSPILPSSSTINALPKPRETILDRAFMMNYIPGSERVSTPGLSSIARFEALMEEMDLEKKTEKGKTNSPRNNDDGHDDSELDPLENTPPTHVTNTPTTATATGSGSGNTLPPAAQSSTAAAAAPLPDAAGLRSSFQSSDLPFRQTTPPVIPNSTSTHKASSSNRVRSRPTSLALPSRSSYRWNDAPESPDRSGLGATDSRRSSQSVKRQSLSDFTRRVSSTGSVLLARSFTAESSSGSPRSSAFSDHSEDVDDDGMFHTNKLSAMPKHSSRFLLDGAPF